jgi:hypothetical protein
MTLLGAGLLVGAGALVAFALGSNGDGDAAQRPLTSVTGATIVELPVTLPTVSPQARDAAPATRTTPSTQPTPVVSTLPLSPLAAELPARVSAVPEAPAGAVAPVLLGIPDLGLMVPIRDIGLEPDGQLEIPDETEVGWYRLGSSPGRAGATVLAAHVSWNDTVGPFVRLGELEPGALIQADLADGTSRTYTVIERAQYPKLMLPSDRIWTRTGDETLVLITCGGDFNRSIRRYADNIVVYAVPVAQSE